MSHWRLFSFISGWSFSAEFIFMCIIANAHNKLSVFQSLGLEEANNFDINLAEVEMLHNHF